MFVCQLNAPGTWKGPVRLLGWGVGLSAVFNFIFLSLSLIVLFQFICRCKVPAVIPSSTVCAAFSMNGSTKIKVNIESRQSVRSQTTPGWISPFKEWDDHVLFRDGQQFQSEGEKLPPPMHLRKRNQIKVS